MTDPAHLIDISSHNDGEILDWSAVRADGIVGAFVKTTQATDYVNPAARVQVESCRSVGIVPGAYHFGDHRYDAVAQARFFITESAHLGLFDAGQLAPAYDAENWSPSPGVDVVWQSRQQLTDHIGAWLDVLAAETDVDRAFVYGSLSWWGSMLVPDDWAGHKIEVLNWVAVYNGDPGNLHSWDHPADALHQHTSDGIVPGINGRVDKNITVRDRTLASLLIGGNDDMQLSDRMTNLWGGTPTVEEVLQYIDYRTWESNEQLRQLTVLVGALAQDPTLTAERAEKIVRDAVTAANDAHLAKVSEVVTRIVGARDEELARETVAEIGKLLVPSADTSDK